MKPSLFARTAAPAILLVSLWLVAVDNPSYWNLIGELSDGQGPWFLVSLLVFTVAVVNLLLSLITFGRSSRYVLFALLTVSAAAAWFMDNLGIVFDDGMLGNIFETDRAEATELISAGLLLNVLLTGVLPGLLVWRLLPARQKVTRILADKAATIGLTLLALGIAVAPFYKDYASLLRNHRELRYMLTPVNYLRALETYASDAFRTVGREAESKLVIGDDASKGHHWAGVDRRTVTIMVVGETARADHFSLGGYERETTPRLAQQNILYFSDVHACGTDTRISLPCMFSDLGKAGFSRAEAQRREDLLDVLEHAGIRTVWLDNNSGCKGVCGETPDWSPAGLTLEGLCEDGECYDEILLRQLDTALAEVDRDTVIVLHQNGSHGPAYYRRYPEAFRQFLPDCRSDDLSDCSREEIVNSYDNSIYYTDFLLTEIIGRLEGRSAEFDTALLYVSDHGESLGEYGLYLHGTPYFLAPEAQTHVPMFLWLSNSFSEDFGINPGCLAERRNAELSHDNLFHSMLGLLDVTTSVRDESLDFVAGCDKLSGTSMLTAAP